MCDAQKGEKGRILNCIGILNPQDCLNHQLNAFEITDSKVVSQTENKQLHTQIQVSLIIRHKTP